MNDTTERTEEATGGNAAAPRALVVRNPELPDDVIEALVTAGDVSALTPAQRVTYYRHRCRSLGLDAASQPFQYLRLQGRLILYASKSCAQSLAARDGLSFQVVGYQQVGDVYVVQGRITGGARSTDDLGAVPIQGLRGDALANALMKARTKAHRRCVLSHCGLGELDESEVETIAGAERIAPAAAHVEPIPAVADASSAPAPPAARAPAGGPTITPAQAKRLWAIGAARAKALAAASPETAGDLTALRDQIVHAALATCGVEHMRDLTRADYEAACAEAATWTPPEADARGAPDNGERS